MTTVSRKKKGKAAAVDDVDVDVDVETASDEAPIVTDEEKIDIGNEFEEEAFASGKEKKLQKKLLVSSKKVVKKGKKVRESEGEQVINSSEDIATVPFAAPGQLVTQNRVHALCDLALISFNKVQILEPPKKWLFGRWNNRAIRPLQVKGLVRDMAGKDLAPFALENALILIINRKHLDEQCISKALAGREAPEFVLSKAGLKELTSLSLAGGRHREAAMRVILREYQDEIDANKRLLSGKGGKKSKKGRMETLGVDTVAKYQKAIAKGEEQMREIGWWGLRVYDEGMHLTSV